MALKIVAVNIYCSSVNTTTNPEWCEKLHYPSSPALQGSDGEGFSVCKWCLLHNLFAEKYTGCNGMMQTFLHTKQCLFFLLCYSALGDAYIIMYMYCKYICTSVFIYIYIYIYIARRKDESFPSKSRETSMHIHKMRAHARLFNISGSVERELSNGMLHL